MIVGKVLANTVKDKKNYCCEEYCCIFATH